MADPGFRQGGGVNPQGRGGSTWFCQNFSKTAWNWKNLGAWSCQLAELFNWNEILFENPVRYNCIQAWTRVGFKQYVLTTLAIILIKLHQYPFAQISFFTFFLTVLDRWCHKFSEGYLSNFSIKLSSQIFYFFPRNFLIKEERIGNVVSTSHWIRHVLRVRWPSPSPRLLLCAP